MTETSATENSINVPGLGRSSIGILYRFVLPLLAFSVGVLVALYLFPIDYLFDRWSYWGRAHGDNTAGLIGYLYFAQDEWRWPLFDTKLLNPPGGVNIIFTDPIPVAALLGKIIYKLTDVLPRYVGAWTLLSYGLQSFVAWLIFRQVGLRPGLALAAAMLVLLTPAFIFRYGHIGLVAHFVILAAILFYLRTVTVASTLEMALSAVAIGAISFVNPYLLAMSAPIFIAGLMEAAWRGRISWRDAAALVALMVAVVGALAFAFGIIGPGRLPPDGYTGFGLYSLNLLSPVTPQLSAVPGHESYLLDKTGGQYEGFNYLGAGILFLILSAVVFRFGSVREMVLRNQFLAATLIGLSIFALSSKIYIGPWQIIDLGYEAWPILSSLTSVFRASGRFFWPVGYVLMVGAIAVLAKSVAYRTVFLLFVAAIAIQLIDIRPLLHKVRVATQPSLDTKSGPLADQIDSWTRVIKAHDEITLFPRYHCAQPSDHVHFLQLQLIAARANIPVNAAYINRLPELDCPGDRRHVLRTINASSVTSNPLIVIFKDNLFKDGFPASALKTEAAAGFSCRDAAFAFACSRQHDDSAFIALGQEFEPLRLPLGSQLALGQGGNGLPFMGAGWSSADANSRWADGDMTSVLGLLERTVCNELTFRASVWPFSYGDHIVRRARVILNGQSTGEIAVSSGQQVVSHRIDLEGRCVDTIKLELRFDGLRSPLELGMNGDTRRLSWLFNWFSFSGD